MKKNWLMLLMISSVCTFTACSDDDNDNGGNSGNSPISELYMSDEMIVGDETTVLGKGFAADAQVYVENASGEWTEIENVKVSDKGITFVLPALANGEYSLILKQNGGDWKLGTFKAVNMKEITLLKQVSYVAKMQGSEEEIMPSVSPLTYDKYGKLKSFSLGSYEDEEGNTVEIAYEFDYTDNSIEVGGSAINNISSFPITFTLDNGIVVASKTKKQVLEYEFDADGNLVFDGNGDPVVLKDTIEDVESTWNYDNGYLKSLTGSDEVTFNFVNGNLENVNLGGMDCAFGYGSMDNTMNTDIVPWCLMYLNDMTAEQVLPHFIGACGKVSAKLPVQAYGNACTCTPSKDGMVWTVKVTSEVMGAMFDSTLIFEFETVKVLPE